MARRPRSRRTTTVRCLLSALSRLSPLIRFLPTDRSPIFKASQITAPLLLLQGTDDKVVPQSQAETMLDEVKKNGVTCEMLLFEGEGHGFRGRDARKRAMEAELGWYRKTWGIEADE